MNISIRNLVPTPLKDSINPKSNIWNNSFTFEKGKHYLIDANSGKGKSTFIQSLYGIRRDYEGEITIDNNNIKSLNKITLAEVRQKNISIVFQDLRLFPELSAIENISINTELSQNKYTQDLNSLFERLNISHIKNKMVKFLSYGERQRVSIIRAITQQYDWILLDEPFAHLDIENTTKAFELILEVSNKLNAGIILTSLGDDDFINFENKLFI